MCEFSHRFLGVDPLYLWTGNEPPKRESVTLPAATGIAASSPAFRYRGWFLNDEDLLTG